ncbi:ABC transporter substrate-binding protein [Devosia sp. UYZn731]|uniref:ABC transporter substrate-binding protein n=1 Tax=Devosia sp. UYZn731 TaxID=3156345 RepID=UPI0033999684
MAAAMSLTLLAVGGSAAQELAGVKLTMWVAQASATLAKQPAEAFEAATGAHVDLVVVPDPYESNIPTKLATGEKPDLAFYQPTVSALPVIQPANNLLPLDGEPWVQKIGTTEQGLGIINGVRYAAIVKSPSISGVYYNKAVFAKAGITAMPQNYDELVALAKSIKAAEPDVAPFYEAGGDKWPVQWHLHALLSGLDQAFWQDVNANEASWTDPRFVAAVAKYKADIIDGGLAQANYQTGTFEEQASSLIDGTAAMIFQVDALTPLLLSKLSVAELNDKIGWLPVSATAPQSQFVADQTNGVVAFKTGDAAREAASKKFIDFWLGDDYAKFIQTNNYPSIEPAVPSPAGLPDITVAQSASLSSATGMWYLYVLTAPDIHLYLNDLLFGAKTPEEVADAMQRQFVQIAKAQGAAGF